MIEDGVMTEGRQAVTQSCEAGPGHAAVVDERRCVSAGLIFFRDIEILQCCDLEGSVSTD